MATSFYKNQKFCSGLFLTIFIISFFLPFAAFGLTYDEFINRYYFDRLDNLKHNVAYPRIIQVSDLAKDAGVPEAEIQQYVSKAQARNYCFVQKHGYPASVSDLLEECTLPEPGGGGGSTPTPILSKTPAPVVIPGLPKAPLYYLGPFKLNPNYDKVICGQTYTFTVDNYTEPQVWLFQTKNTNPVYNGLLNIPDTYTSVCNRDEGIYFNQVFKAAGGHKGETIGTNSLEIQGRPGVTTGAVPAAPVFKIIGIFPDVLNKQDNGAILIKGSAFKNPQLTTDNQAVQFSNVVVDEDGESIRADIKIGATSAQTVSIKVSDSGRSDQIALKLIEKNPAAPVIENVSLSNLGREQNATLQISGNNLSGASVEVVGASAIVTNVESSENTLTATLQFSEDYQLLWRPEKLALIGEVLAAGEECFNPDNNDDWDYNCSVYSEENKNCPRCSGHAGNQKKDDGKDHAVVRTQNDKGSDTASVDTPDVTPNQPAKGPEQKLPAGGSKRGTSNFPFELTNPFKGGAENALDILKILANFVFQLGIPVAVIIIIYSGITILISAGKPALYQRGINGLKYAAIGLAILLIGKGFVSLIQSILSVK